MERIGRFLEEREKSGLLRTLKPAASRKDGLINFKGKTYIDFCSNDYLGLSGHPALKSSQKEAIDRFGSSASASRLLSGDLDIHHELEEKTAHFKGKESALIFNSGYQANLGVISALMGRGDVIFSDRLNHASIVDGIALSGAKFFRFKHNSTADLEELLKTHRKNFKRSLIITETIFSMDGDKAPLKKLVELKENYDSFMMIDEAHATGIFGEGGSGVAEEEGVTSRIEIIMGTFGKALGSFGAYVACSENLRSYLINASRSFIYSTALPPSVISANIKSIGLVREEPYRRKALLENAYFFREELQKNGFKVKGSSQIVPLITGESDPAVKLARRLRDKNYWVLPIRPPTVPEGASRLRFSVTYYHTKDLLKKLCNDIVQIHR